jgi:membrane-bound lytic murein transglycosylase B
VKARFFFVLALCTGLAAVPFVALADTAAEVSQRRADLQTELDALNAQIADQQTILEQKQGQSASFQRDISILNTQVQKDELSIRARTISIQQLTDGISTKDSALSSLNDQLTSELQSLAEILRKTNVIDQSTLAELILSSDSVSTFYGDLNSFAEIQGALQQSFNQITSTKTATVAAKTDLENQRTQEEALLQQQVIQENQVKADKAQETTLLAASKAQESQYQSVIQATQKVVSQIEAELFALRDTAPIPFSQALAYAEAASSATGVQPAFILGILKQESDLGANVGACYVTSLTTGNGIGKNSGTFFSGVMKVPRDTVPFASITGALGIPWATAPVSCPTPGGYGGAMGPSQFIPSTWQLYESRLATALGAPTPNPWEAKDAIMATALYLDDIGGGGGGYTAERNAACKYYSGRTCDNRSPSNQFYGDEVMDNAAYFQNQIDLVNGT